jgi:hypothetical protein
LSVFCFSGLSFTKDEGITLKDKGVISCEIVVPEATGPVETFAGKEMKEFLSKALGSDISLLKAPSGLKQAIILGDSELSRSNGVDISGLPRDGFIIKFVGGNIYIAGKDDMAVNPEKNFKEGYWGQLYQRGTLFGVYDFLERFAGVRFYFPGEIGTVIPKLDSLIIPTADIVSKPDYSVRNLSAHCGITPDGKDNTESFPYKNINYSRLRLQTAYIPNCHGLSRLGYLKRFGESHPEYFALMTGGKRYNDPALPHSGQLCYSSAVKEEIYRDAEAYLTGKPAAYRGVITDYGRSNWDPSGFQPGYFNIMPQDGFYECRCPECQKHFAKGAKDTSEFVWDFVCGTAEKLKKNNVPGYLTMMGYTPYRLIPERPIPDNVLIMVALAGPWTLHISAMYDKEEDVLKSWVDKQGKKVWLWNYANKFGPRKMSGIPHITPKCIAKYYKLQKPYIFGAYMESETDYYIYNYLNFYVFAKVCWDNSTDVDTLLNEHYKLMFGAASGIMENIYERFESNWLAAIGKPVETPQGPSSAPVSDYELWEKIYSDAQIQDLEKQFATAEAFTANDADSLKRVKFMRLHLLEPLKKQREIYLENKKEISDLSVFAAEVPSLVAIDGIVNADEWAGAEKISLHPFKESAGKATVETTVMILRDKEKLYISFDCAEPFMDRVASSSRKFDDRDIWRDSSVEIFLNPSGDRIKYFQILVNASGSISDLACEKIGAVQKEDWNWNSGANVTTCKTGKGWSVEISVPLKTLENIDPKGFPVNFNRSRILSANEQDYASLYTWSPFIKGFHQIENFGSVRFTKEDDGNIIENSNFTEPPKDRFFGGWFAQKKEDIKAGGSWAIVSDTFTKGGKSLMLRSMEKGNVCITQYLPGIKPDTEYMLTFFLKTDNVVPLGATVSGICVNIWDDSNRWFPVNFYTGSMPWTKQGFRFKSSPETNKKTKSYLRLRIMNASGTVWFDDVRLREISK